MFFSCFYKYNYVNLFDARVSTVLMYLNYMDVNS